MKMPEPTRSATPDGPDTSGESGNPALSTDELLHELQVHQIELEMQNENLRDSQSELAEARDRYADLYELAPMGYLTLRNTSQVAEINLTGVMLLGSERRNLLDRRFEQFVAPSARELWNEWFIHLRNQEGAQQSIEVELQRADNSIFWARIVGRNLIQAGEQPNIRLAVLDISERKKAEGTLEKYKSYLEELVAIRTAELHTKEKRISQFSRLTATLSAVNQAIVKYSNLDEIFDAACHACVVRGGYKLAWMGQLVENSPHLEIRHAHGHELDFLDDFRVPIQPVSPEAFGPSATAFREQHSYICRDYHADPAALPWREKAERYGIRSSISLPINCEGQPWGVLTAYANRVDSFDWEAEKLLEEIAQALSFAVGYSAVRIKKQANAVALQESETLLHEAQKIAGLGHWTYALETGVLTWSPQLYRLYGRDPAQGPASLEDSKHFYDHSCGTLIEDAATRAMANFTREELQLQGTDSNGNVVYHALAIIPKQDAQGRTTHLYGTVQDITAHKLAEEKLRRLTQELQQTANEVTDLYQNAPCGYHSLDKNGLICQINDTELRWLGYSRQEIVGKLRLPDLMTPASQTIFNYQFPLLMKAGVLRDVELELIRKDGSILSVMISSTSIVDADGAFLMSRSTVYDMTERQKMERERTNYIRRLAELSRHLVAVQEGARRHLAGELHDHTSPNLAAIGINLAMIARMLPENQFADVLARLDDTQALIRDTTANIREICADLRPPVLDYAGLPAALDTYTRQFAQRTGIQVDIKCENQTKRLASDLESLLFRITQESLTNCAKHAHASLVSIRLKNEASPVVLSITDNGDGLAEENLGKNGQDCGLGILNMREMAEFAGGTFKIESTPGEGTRITVEIP